MFIISAICLTEDHIMEDTEDIDDILDILDILGITGDTNHVLQSTW